MTAPAPTLAVIGGGQLARMMAQPAIALGLPLRLLAEGEGVSAAQVIPDHLVGDYRDLDTLVKATDGCAVVTFDHEHVPTEHLHALAESGLAVRPGPEALVHAQDKAVMREAISRAGRAQPPVRRRRILGRRSRRSVSRACSSEPGVATTARGSGSCGAPRSARSRCASAAASGVQLLAEELVDFRRELSALVARSPSGQAAAYPVVESTQRDGICHEVVAPAPGLDPDLASRAQELALRVAGALDVTGILAVELFETADGRVLVNELAMRPHNTGHWTQDGAVTSQFENHLRAVMDLPLGSPAARAPWTVMVNILGGPAQTGRLYDGFPHAMARDPFLRVHLYGKELRPGRKVGHVNAYGDDLEDCLERARHAAAWFRGDLGDESE